MKKKGGGWKKWGGVKKRWFKGEKKAPVPGGHVKAMLLLDCLVALSRALLLVLSFGQLCGRMRMNSIVS